MIITQRTTRRFAALAAVPLLVGLFVGCSAAEQPAPKTTSDASEKTSQQEYDEWTLKLNACMKDKGYDLPAPGSTSDKGVEIEGDMADFEAAMKECQDKIGPGPGGTVDQKSSDAMLDGILKLNACLRERGYDIEDPAPGSNSISMPSGVDPEDIKACQAASGGGPSAG